MLNFIEALSQLQNIVVQHISNAGPNWPLSAALFVHSAQCTPPALLPVNQFSEQPEQLFTAQVHCQPKGIFLLHRRCSRRFTNPGFTAQCQVKSSPTFLICGWLPKRTQGQLFWRKMYTLEAKWGMLSVKDCLKKIPWVKISQHSGHQRFLKTVWNQHVLGPGSPPPCLGPSIPCPGPPTHCPPVAPASCPQLPTSCSPLPPPSWPGPPTPPPSPSLSSSPVFASPPPTQGSPSSWPSFCYSYFVLNQSGGKEECLK